MTDAGAAVGMDRLPWLDDEPAPRAEIRPREPKRPRTKNSGREVAGWAFAGVLLVAGASFWLGTQSGERAVGNQSESPSSSQPESTVRLPEASRMPSVPIVETPEVRPAPTPTVAIPNVGRPVRRDSSGTRRRTLQPMDMKNSDLSKTVAKQEGEAGKTEPAKTDAAEAAKPVAAPAVKPLASRSELKLWPARESKGASGRLVQIGAFGSRQQAKLGWRRMQRAYPAVGRLPATVVTSRNSRGKRFYRFQIGTTSQAHSEVLCQRMQKIRFSCAVVGLSWKSKVER